MAAAPAPLATAAERAAIASEARKKYPKKMPPRSAAEQPVPSAAPAVAAPPAAAVAAPPADPVKRKYTKRVAAAPAPLATAGARAEIASPAPPLKKGKSRDPSICHEKSRFQFLVRSGELLLKSEAFRYNDDCTAAKAEEDAQRLLTTWTGLWNARELFGETVE